LQSNNQYIEIDFSKLWKLVRLKRQTKEALKTALFSLLPFLFSRFASYQHWKNARVFAYKEKYNTINIKTARQQPGNKELKLAVVIHVFYIDVFKEILSLLLKNKTVSFKIFITCPENLHDSIDGLLNQTGISYSILSVKNRGRDVLPFLKILPVVFDENYNLILKLHTKRSNHLNKKDLWSTDLFSKLIGEGEVKKIYELFIENNEVGMAGPEGHILPMSLYYGGNPERVRILCEKMGLQKQQLKRLLFVAGSMFYARKEVLLPVLNLGLKDEDFEEENSQLDKTMAHAVERVFGAGVVFSGFELADTNSSFLNFSCKITLNHPFTI